MAESRITPCAQDFAAWYQDVVLQGDMAEPAEIVKGCMVIKPNGYAVWEALQRAFENSCVAPSGCAKSKPPRPAFAWFSSSRTTGRPARRELGTNAQSVLVNLLQNAIEAVAWTGAAKRDVDLTSQKQRGDGDRLFLRRGQRPGSSGRGAGAPVRALLHDQAERHRTRARDLPALHRGPRRPDSSSPPPLSEARVFRGRAAFERRPAPGDGMNEKVLVIDDEKSFRIIAQEALSSAGRIEYEEFDGSGDGKRIRKIAEIECRHAEVEAETPCGDGRGRKDKGLALPKGVSSAQQCCEQEIQFPSSCSIAHFRETRKRERGFRNAIHDNIWMICQSNQS